MPAGGRIGAVVKGNPRSRTRHPRTETETAFLNIPYDAEFESLYLAFIAGVSGFGLIPRATIELPGSKRRLDRILGLIRKSHYSFHDLSRVQLDRRPPSTPRFNMPFELGLAVAHFSGQRWFVFEARPYRLNKSLSDLDGTDPYIHGGTVRGVLRCLANALSRSKKPPRIRQLEAIYRDLRTAARKIKSDIRGGTLFETGPFRELVVIAKISAKKNVGSVKSS